MIVIRGYQNGKLQRMKITNNPKVIAEFSQNYDGVEYMTSTYNYNQLKEQK